MSKRKKIALALVGVAVIACIIYLVVTREPAEQLQVQVIQSDYYLYYSSGSAISTGKGFVALNDVIKPGFPNAVYSPNTLYMIVLMLNGELQVRKGGIVLWRTGIQAPGEIKNCYARLEANGLTVRTATNYIVWQQFGGTNSIKDINKLVIGDDGSCKLVNSANKNIYTMNLNRLPAIGPRCKIDQQTFVGSMTNDSCLALNAEGQLVVAACHPRLKDKHVAYYEYLYGYGQEPGIASVELTAEKTLVAKRPSKPDIILLTDVYIITSDQSGNITSYSSFDAYMNKYSTNFDYTPIQSQVSLNTVDSPDFVKLKSPFAIRARTNPFYLYTKPNGTVQVLAQHLDQNLNEVVKEFPGIDGFSSANYNVVVAFGPLYDYTGVLYDSLNSVSICLVDPRPYDQTSSDFNYKLVFDPKAVIKNQPPLNSNDSSSFLFQVAKSQNMSRVVVVHSFDLIGIASVLTLGEDGSILFKQLHTGTLVGPVLK